MSRRAISAGLERINRVGGGERENMCLQAIAVYDVDGTVEKSTDVTLEPGIVEGRHVGSRVDLDKYIDIAGGPFIATGDGSEKRSVALIRGLPAVSCNVALN